MSIPTLHKDYLKFIQDAIIASENALKRKVALEQKQYANTVENVKENLKKQIQNDKIQDGNEIKYMDNLYNSLSTGKQNLKKLVGGAYDPALEQLKTNIRNNKYKQISEASEQYQQAFNLQQANKLKQNPNISSRLNTLFVEMIDTIRADNITNFLLTVINEILGIVSQNGFYLETNEIEKYLGYCYTLRILITNMKLKDKAIRVIADSISLPVQRVEHRLTQLKTISSMELTDRQLAMKGLPEIDESALVRDLKAVKASRKIDNIDAVLKSKEGKEKVPILQSLARKVAKSRRVAEFRAEYDQEAKPAKEAESRVGNWISVVSNKLFMLASPSVKRSRKFDIVTQLSSPEYSLREEDVKEIITSPYVNNKAKKQVIKSLEEQVSDKFMPLEQASKVQGVIAKAKSALLGYVWGNSEEGNIDASPSVMPSESYEIAPTPVQKRDKSARKKLYDDMEAFPPLSPTVLDSTKFALTPSVPSKGAQQKDSAWLKELKPADLAVALPPPKFVPGKASAVVSMDSTTVKPKPADVPKPATRASKASEVAVPKNKMYNVNGTSVMFPIKKEDSGDFYGFLTQGKRRAILDALEARDGDRINAGKQNAVFIWEALNKK